MIVLTAVLKAAEGKSDAIIAEFSKLVPLVLKDPGTLGYMVCQAVDDPSKLIVIEQYESREALTYHGGTPHFKAFGQATRGMFADRAQISMWNKVA